MYISDREINVKICQINAFLCKGDVVGHVKIPDNPERRSLWLASLNLESIPSGDKRLCRKHFKNSDFIENNSYMVLKDNAIPTRQAPHMALSRIFSEHSYSASNVSKEALIKSTIKLIYCLSVLLFTFIGFLVYLLEEEDYEYLFEASAKERENVLPYV